MQDWAVPIPYIKGMIPDFVGSWKPAVVTPCLVRQQPVVPQYH